MPLYIDIHELGSVTAEDVAKAHALDMEKQAAHHVNYLKYWVNEDTGRVFCLCEAPDPEAAEAVHMEAHGLRPGRILPVQPEMVEAFTGGGEVNLFGAATLRGGLDNGTRTILFTDIVDSTGLIQRLGDQAVVKLLKLHDTVVRGALKAFSGREVKHTGDGIMACFVLAADAVKAAIQIQRDIAMYAADENAVRLRIGLATGEPVEHHGDFYGSSVNLAARLCAHAKPEQILVCTGTAQVCGDEGLRFADLGEVPLKGFDRPVRAHAAQP